MIEDYTAECEVHKVKYNKRIKNLWWYGQWTACKHTNATYHGWRNYMACPDCKIGAWKGMKMSDLDRSNFE